MAAAPPMNPSTARLVSRYGERPSRRDGTPHFHGGLDISSGRAGDPVFSVKEGTVELVAENTNPRGMNGYGNAVVIQHGNLYTLYAHLNSVLVTAGQTVRSGQQIGTMGNTTNGQFSPLPGQDVEAWRAAARARGYNSGPMAPHLHFETRRARADGSSPFPGPYPRSAAEAGTSQDPRGWLSSHGMVFTRRGGIEIQPGSAADRSRSVWEPLHAAAALGAVDSKGATAPASYTAPPSGGGLLPPGAKLVAGYEPSTFERDTRFGLTSIEWGALGIGAVALVGAVVVVNSRRLRKNKRRRRVSR